MARKLEEYIDKKALRRLERMFSILFLFLVGLDLIFNSKLTIGLLSLSIESVLTPLLGITFILIAFFIIHTLK